MPPEAFICSLLTQLPGYTRRLLLDEPAEVIMKWCDYFAAKAQYEEEQMNDTKKPNQRHANPNKPNAISLSKYEIKGVAETEEYLKESGKW